MDPKVIEAAYRAKSAESFTAFVRGLRIVSHGRGTVFDGVMADFQRETFDALAPTLHAVRDGEMPDARRFWIERTKKAGKDSDLAVCLLWLVAFARRPLYLQVGAADKDQAGIVKRRIADLLHWNPWLEELVEVQRWKVRSELAELDILAADVSGSHGETPDVLVINELSHITKWEFIENLADNADGVPHGVMLIATNAGFKGTKAETWRRNAMESDDWSCHVFKGPAPWHSKEMLEDNRRRNLRSGSRFKRLWDPGEWVSGKGDALDEADIDRCFRDYEPLTGPEDGWRYIAGLDLGVSHDHSGLAVVGVNALAERIKVVQLQAWEPGDGEVDLQAVEDACLAVSRRFRIEWFGYDPTEAKLMAQRLHRQGVPMHEVSFAAPKNMTAMAQSLVQLVEAGKLECFPSERLRRDFGKFAIVERGASHYKLESTRDEYGHADVGTALVIALPRAIAMLDSHRALQPDDSIAGQLDEELSDKEVKAMHPEMRELLEL